MTRGTHIRAMALLGSISVLLALPGAVRAEAPVATAATGVTLSVDKAGERRALLDKVTVSGALSASSPGEAVQVTVTASGRELISRKLVASTGGTFSLDLVVDACCDYVIKAEAGGQSATTSFSVQVPKKLRKGPITALYNRSLQRMGFHTGTKGGRVTLGTRLATKAFRKTNGMRRSEAYSPAIFSLLLQGRGAFDVKYPNAGRHVEVDLSKQVMALIKGGQAVKVFHISSGASGTRTVRGKFRFYRREPGYNNKRMYFSVYFIRGYAIHGYSPVPNEPASHGCVRNPIPFSRFIYNWVDIGMPIYVFA